MELIGPDMAEQAVPSITIDNPTIGSYPIDIVNKMIVPVNAMKHCGGTINPKSEKVMVIKTIKVLSFPLNFLQRLAMIASNIPVSAQETTIKVPDTIRRIIEIDLIADSIMNSGICQGMITI